MANQLVRFGLGLFDEDGVKSNVYQFAEIPEATTLTELATTGTDWATAFMAMSDAGTNRFELCLIISPDTAGLPTTPSADEEVSETGSFQWDLAGTTYSWSSVVPALSESIETTTGIDTTNSAVIAYTALLTGALFTSGFFCSPEALQITARKATFLGVRKHRRQLHAKTYRVG